jgi:hypothetical protein
MAANLPCRSDATTGPSVEWLQVMAHPSLAVHPGDHGLSEQDGIEDLQIA